MKGGRGEKKHPAPTASTAGTSLCSISEALQYQKVPRHLHLVNCFQEGMLECDDPMGQCFSRFPKVSQRSRVRGKEEEGTG